MGHACMVNVCRPQTAGHFANAIQDGMAQHVTSQVKHMYHALLCDIQQSIFVHQTTTKDLYVGLFISFFLAIFCKVLMLMNAAVTSAIEICGVSN